MYTCFEVHLRSHWDIPYHQGQICVTVLGQGLKYQRQTRKFSEEYDETITVTEEILSTPWISFPMPPAKLKTESRQIFINSFSTL